MNQQSSLDVRSECFSKFSSKFPSLKSEVIKQAINNFNCDYDKINDYLTLHSFEESTSFSKKSSTDSMKSPGYFSFASLTSDSLESDSNSSAAPRNHYRNSTELSTISSQTCDLKRLQEAYKGMEVNRDYLTKEMEYLKEISNQRKSVPNFPNINELEKLERIINKKYSMPPKSMSYANDLRKPEEMNARYRGFHQPYNEYSQISNNNNINTNDHNNSRRSSDNVVIKNPLNPNFYISPKPKKNLLSPFKKQDEKRNSAHFAENFELPEELVGHTRGHFRQKSDPWILENLERNTSNVNWICPQCSTPNNLLKCSFCQYDKLQSDRL